MYVRDDFAAPVNLPVGASVAATNAAAAVQTQGAPSATADAMIFSTPDVSQNPVSGGGIFTIADQLAQPATATALAGPTADVGVIVSQAAASGQGAAAMVAANPLIAWGVFGVLSLWLFGKKR